MRKLTLLTALAAFAALVALTAMPAASAKAPGANGRIAFARFDPAFGDDATYTMNPNGSDVQPLFPSFASNSPHWSPDGAEVAVVSGLGIPCPPTCTGNTVIINPATGDYRVLASQGFPAVSTFCSIWSPDASHFVCDGENDSDASVNGLYTIRSSDGGGLTRITNAGGGADLPIDYSPDGQQIVFARTDPFHNCDSKSALYVVNVDGSGLHRITPWGFCDDDGSWSPDGTKIAFASGKRLGKIYVVRPDGTGLAQIPIAVSSLGGLGDVSWSPDGTKIAFILFTRRGPGTEQDGIYTANADGTDVQQLTTTFEHQTDWGPHPLTP
jgi:Tol biopolymer transport system component